MQYAIFAAIGILLIAIVAYGWPRSKKLNRTARQEVIDAWRGIEDIEDPVLRIVEADKVLDLAMKRLGYEGTFKDKFTKAKSVFPNASSLWKGHLLRNRLVHEPGARVTQAEARRVIVSIDAALRRLW